MGASAKRASFSSVPSTWLVYLLRCADDTLYCGITNRLQFRLRAHGRGQVKYTRGRLPVGLFFFEPVANRSAALKSEAKWKRLSRAQKFALKERSCR